MSAEQIMMDRFAAIDWRTGAGFRAAAAAVAEYVRLGGRPPREPGIVRDTVIAARRRRYHGNCASTAETAMARHRVRNRMFA